MTQKAARSLGGFLLWKNQLIIKGLYFRKLTAVNS